MNDTFLTHQYAYQSKNKAIFLLSRLIILVRILFYNLE